MNAPNLPLYYRDARKPRPMRGNGHHGLWYERFFDQYDEQWRVYEESKDEHTSEGKREWLKTVTGKAGDSAALQAAGERLTALCLSLGGDFRVVSAPWHFATGLGNPHPVENGFLWHPTLGAPFLPGAALKGLLRAWVEAWMEFDDAAQRTATLHRWFGSEDKDPAACERDSQSGGFIFFDALPVAPVELKADVMTPHMGGWYEQGGEAPLNPEVTPADWHNPVPVPFLVADRPKFLVAVAPRSEAEKADAVMAALADALEWLGAGAKTAAGYGRLCADKSEGKRIRAKVERTTLNEAEYIQAEVARYTLEQLAEKFGKERNKTKAALGDAWGRYLEAIIAIHGETIRGWNDASAKPNEKKAYKTFFERTGGN